MFELDKSYIRLENIAYSAYYSPTYIMKFLLFASTALALVKRQGDVLQADVNAIIANVNSLQTTINDFKGVEQADALVAASEAVVSAIQKAATDAKASPPLSYDDIALFIDPLANLIPVVQATVTTLVDKKQLFVDSGRGCEVYPQLIAQQTATQAFSDNIVPKVPDELKDIASQIAVPILQSLSDGAAAFKDVQCAATSTSSSAAATSTTISASSSEPPATTTTASQGSTASNTSSGSQTGTASETGTATQTSATASATETGSKTHSGSATATGTEPCDVTTAVEVDTTETVPCTTETGSGSQPTGSSGCKECGPGETSPGSGSGPGATTLTPIASGGNGGNGGSGSSPSPSSPVVIAGASRGAVPVAVAIAAVVGAMF